MKLESVTIENYRAIEHLRLPLDPSLTVLHGGNTCGKTSVLSAIAVGLGVIPDLLPGVSGIDFLRTDLRAGESFVQVDLTATDGLPWKRERFVRGMPPGPFEDPQLTGTHERFVEDAPAPPETTTRGLDALKDKISVAGWTYGAEAGDVLSVVMGVDERPVNEFTEALARYRRLVGEGQGESEEAVALRATPERLSPDDPALSRADLEVRKHRLFEEMAKSV